MRCTTASGSAASARTASSRAGIGSPSSTRRPHSMCRDPSATGRTRPATQRTPAFASSRSRTRSACEMAVWSRTSPAPPAAAAAAKSCTNGMSPKRLVHGSSTLSRVARIESLPLRASRAPLTVRASPSRYSWPSCWSASSSVRKTASMVRPLGQRRHTKCSPLLRRCRWTARSPLSATGGESSPSARRAKRRCASSTVTSSSHCVWPRRRSLSATARLRRRTAMASSAAAAAAAAAARSAPWLRICI
mmetsp:Transcript_7423/g.24701  ORF Transcript_7423/g.24701 Transcript_7423/m.24701 type:complete len:248 (-) Transcript_7423:16-759(-)